MKSFAALVASLVLWPVAVLAQAPDPFVSAKVHIGPFAVNPSISLANVGLDTNVFNEVVDPKKDFTATITPAADTWLRLGPARLNVKMAGSYQYFAKYGDQRSFGTHDSVRLEFPLLHLRPWAEGAFLTMRDRPGYEINLRLRHSETSVAGGVDLLVSKRTTLGVSFWQTRIDYGGDETYLGVSVRDSFNRTTWVETASLRYALTPLTTVVMAADVVQERFEFSSIRDSDGFRVAPGVEFDASALINGSARVGFRRLRMLASGMPDYTGPVASVDLGYTLMGITRFSVVVNREVEYSYEPAQPFYLLTGVTGSVSQAVGGPWSVNARAGVQRLAYQTIDASAAAALSLNIDGLAGRVDVVKSYGGGVGYKVGPSTRLGVNVDYITRSSQFYAQQYKGLRVGSTVTYGF